jgi:hypothetical protein
MKGGTLFKSDKTEYILLGYATAGITLRQVEINYARLP